ncbi:MAG: DUF3786 domain-containing protein [Eubacteriales bacterium]|nr:DUF3786 domain-containing protein [Eubacteriales bacterium]
MENEKKKNNLQEQPVEFYTQKYREADPAEIAARLQIPFDAEKDCFTVRMFKKTYSVNWPEFGYAMIEEGPNTYDPLARDNGARILMLRYLLFANPTPETGSFISFRDMPSGDLYIQPFQGRCIMRTNRKYGTRKEVFCKVCEKAGAAAGKGGDASYDIEVFDGIFVRFIIWEGDDEFPASSQILFSENIRTAFETYDLAEMGGIILNMMGALEA